MNFLKVSKPTIVNTLRKPIFKMQTLTNEFLHEPLHLTAKRTLFFCKAIVYNFKTHFSFRMYYIVKLEDFLK